MTDVGRAVTDGLSQAEPVSRLGPTGFGPSRAKLAVDRIYGVLNEVDYDCGHFITGDNLRIVDVQILYDAFFGERNDVLAFLRAEAAAARHAQANGPEADKLYRMGQKDALLLAATAIENWHHLNAAIAIETRKGGNEVPSRSDESAGRQASPKGGRP